MRAEPLDVPFSENKSRTRWFNSDGVRAMLMDADIYKAAKLLIDQHGLEAGEYAAARWEQLRREGDEGGAFAWDQILRAVVELQRERRSDEVVN